MPLNPNSLGAPGARFRRPRVLVVGCGDVGVRLVPLLHGARVYALTSSPARRPALRSLGVVPICADLDQRHTLRRVRGLATHLVHLAPPPSTGQHDTRMRALLSVLRPAHGLRSLIYGSTSGVYGDCGGAWVDESRPLQPRSDRARRRVDAEVQLRRWGRSTGVRVGVLRIPGIYAPDRAGATPLQRLRLATPVLRAQDDVYTNHIHADDLARACRVALWRGAAQRVYNVCDDTVLKMGDYMDLAADGYGLSRPPRLAREQVMQTVSPMVWSFMQESRRLRNRRMHKELRLRLRHPTVFSGLFGAAAPGGPPTGPRCSPA